MSKTTQSRPSADDEPYLVRLDGEIDISRKKELRDVVMGFRRSDEHSCAVDMARVTFMDSTGVGSLVALLRTAQSRGGTVTLLDPCPDVLRVLEVTHLDSMLTIEQTGGPRAD